MSSEVAQAMWGSELAHTMWAGLYGRFRPHPASDLSTPEADADPYQLFVARSAAMGWLTDAMRTAPRGLWGMNDAGYGSRTGAQPPLAGWFQVVLTEPLTSQPLLPVQQLLACAADVMARLGDLKLLAVQVLLPSPRTAPLERPPAELSALGSLAQTAGWFANSDGGSSTPIEVSLDGGQVQTISSVASDVFESTQASWQRVFACDGFSTFDAGSLSPPGTIDELWVGPPRHRAVFSGSLVEWTLDAVGWTAAFLAHACLDAGVTTPILFTASRAGPDT